MVPTVWVHKRLAIHPGKSLRPEEAVSLSTDYVSLPSPTQQDGFG